VLSWVALPAQPAIKATNNSPMTKRVIEVVLLTIA